MRVAIIGSGIAGLAAARALAGAPRRHALRGRGAARRPRLHRRTPTATRSTWASSCATASTTRGSARCSTSSAIDDAADDDVVLGRRTTALEWGSASLSAMFADRRRLVDAAPLAVPRRGRAVPAQRAARSRRRARRTTRRSTSTSPRAACPRDVRDRFVVPLAAALWSLAPELCGEFPAETYLQFLDQHGMLRPVRPLAWRTIVGGSRRYVDALLAELRARGRFALRARHAGRRDRARRRAASRSSPRARERRFDRVDRRDARRHRARAARRRRPTTSAACSARSATARTAPCCTPTARSCRAARRARRVELRRRSRYRARRGHVLDDAAAGPARRAVPRHAQPARATPTGVLHEVTFAHPQLDRAALAAQAELPRLGRRAPHVLRRRALRLRLPRGRHARRARRRRARVADVAVAPRRRVSVSLGALPRRARARARATRTRGARSAIRSTSRRSISTSCPRSIASCGCSRTAARTCSRSTTRLRRGRARATALRDALAALRAAQRPARAARDAAGHEPARAGYVFNPVSFFLDYDADGALTSAIAEVNNTYGGRCATCSARRERIAGERARRVPPRARAVRVAVPARPARPTTSGSTRRSTATSSRSRCTSRDDAGQRRVRRAARRPRARR